jgi:hypothetical protein
MDPVVIATEKLRSMLTELDKSVSSASTTRVDQREAILQQVVEPIISAIQTSASHLNGLDAQIYLINSLVPLNVSLWAR